MATRMHTWDAYWRHVGLPEEEPDLGIDRIIDPDRVGPTIWFQIVPEGKVVKNRLHLTVSGGRAVPLARTAWTTTGSQCRTPRATSSA